VLGVELSGALKNIIALATGISSGLGFGDNTKAALITRGIAEIRRLGLRMGCFDQTFSGLAGIGDLIVTATSEHSRNNRCGRLIGSGVKPEDAIKQIGMVVEGINALPAAVALAKKYDVEMPITETAYDIIFGGTDPKSAVMKLMMRDKKTEVENLTVM
jgi:glycerol-3-phosphate dehydrogenase (NAD(P)+)